jgi:hypothetical protein
MCVCVYVVRKFVILSGRLVKLNAQFLCLRKHCLINTYYYLLCLCSLSWAMASSFTRFLDHTKRRTTVGRIPLGRVISSSQRHLPDNTQHTQQTNIHATGGIQNHDRSRRAAVDLRLRPRGHLDRTLTHIWAEHWDIFMYY